MKKIFKKTMLILVSIILIIVIASFFFMQQEMFGAPAKGERLELMRSKSNYKDGAFDNLELTPSLAEGTSYWQVLKGFFFTKKIRNIPSINLPVIKTELMQLSLDSNVYVWFGHSSYYIQLDRKRILVDPVFSPYASPVKGSVKAFNMEYNYSAQDIPEIDVLVISHDHWDHLDYDTFKLIKNKVKHVVTGLGVGAHLEKWGYPAQQITELYWGDHITIDSLSFTATTARHFSGRTFRRNVTLWSAFVLQGKDKKLFLGGDSGYGSHFKQIGDQYGPFDYAILENGQYNQMWKYIHMMPEEVIQAGKDLHAKEVIPVHSAKFPLANHAWDEPLERVTKTALEANFSIRTPRIGEVLSLDNPQKSSEWWKGLD